MYGKESTIAHAIIVKSRRTAATMTGTMGAVEAVAPAKLSVEDHYSWKRDQRFFIGMALAAIVAVFVGFYPTYYLKAWWQTPVLPSLVHLHGLVFTAWIALLATQTSFVAMGRIDLHRRLGITGAVLALVMTVVAFYTAIGAVQRGRITADFLPHALATVVVFPVLVGAAFMMRRRADAHKRLMWIATTELLAAAVGRWPVIWRSSAFVSYAATDVFLAALLVYDLATRRRPHPATIWGGAFLITSQILRTIIAPTATWLAFARWLTT